MNVATGLDRLVAEGFARLRGSRVGLLCHPASVDRRLIHIIDLIEAIPDIRVGRIFGPEHGVDGQAQDMVAVGRRERDPHEVISLYGTTIESLRPRPEHLADLDVLAVDLQDVGSRFYTFAATMFYCMEEAAKAGLRVMVLDRPNPIGGVQVEGPTIQSGFESFVGAHPMPIRHGLTIGELARLYKEDRGLDLELEIVPCEDWLRFMHWVDTGLPWVLPSPNMPTPETALVYPGGCLIEGTNLSEGRGTTRPFELWGAPWMRRDIIIFDTGWNLAGAHLRACRFRPMFQKHAERDCVGYQVHVTDRDRFQPVRNYLHVIGRVRFGWSEFAWRTESYEFVSDPIAIDLLFGSDRERLALEMTQGIHWSRLYGWLDEVADSWRSHEEAFLDRRAPVLLYP